MIFKILLVFIFLFLGQLKVQNTYFQILNLITFLTIGAFSLSRIPSKNVEKLSLAIVSIICLSYLTSIFILYPKIKTIDLDDPVPETYVSDEKDFLKTFYLMKQGQNYYSAFENALEGDARFQSAPRDSYAWRFPVIFYLWNMLAQNGEQIRQIFIILSTTSIFCAYFISKKLTGPKTAVLSSYLIVPYFLDPLTSTSFIFMEWWGLFFFISSITAFFYQRKKLAYALLFLSVSSRELFILPAATFAAIDFYKSRKITLPLTFAILIGTFWALHMQQVAAIVEGFQISPSSRIHSFDKNFLMSALAFSTRLYELATLRIGTLFLLLSSVGLIRLYLFAKNAQKSLILIAFTSFFVTFLLVPFMGTRALDQGIFYYADYWGIIFVPLSIIFTPTLLPKSNKS